METKTETAVSKPKKRGRKACGIPLAERKKIYDENMKMKVRDAREKAKELKKTTDITQQKLYFLTHIIKSQNLKYSDVTRLSGISQQSLSWMIINDDTKLTNARKILHSLGMELLPEFAEIEKVPIDFKGLNYEIVGDIPTVKRINSADPIVDKSLDEAKDLYFLAKFLTENKISLTELSEKTGISVASYRNSFTKQNIMISTLYKIADAYDTKIIWRVKAL